MVIDQRSLYDKILPTNQPTNQHKIVSHYQIGHKVALTLSFALIGVSHSALAAVTTFSDKTVFLSATGATDATGALPNLGFINSGSATLGSVTFSQVDTQHRLWIGAGNYTTDLTPILSGNDLGIDNTEDLNIAVNGSIYSFGFDFVEPSIGGNILAVPGSCNLPACVDSTFSVTLKNGATLLDSFNFSAPDDVAAFVGVWSDQAFDHVEIREVSGGIDNEYFGRVYTGVTPVPVPAALWLFGSGLAGFWGLRKKRRV